MVPVLTISFIEIDDDLVKRFLNAAHCGDVSSLIELLDAGMPVNSPSPSSLSLFLRCAAAYNKKPQYSARHELRNYHNWTVLERASCFLKNHGEVIVFFKNIIKEIHKGLLKFEILHANVAKVE